MKNTAYSAERLPVTEMLFLMKE